jgi:hypothetical protein
VSHLGGMSISQGAFGATFGGSFVAIASGLISNASEGAPSSAALVVALAGLMTASGGLVTAIGSQVIALVKIWVDQRRQDREAKMERHNLANRLNAANLEIKDLSEVLEQDRRRIEEQNLLVMNLSKAHGVNRGRIEDQQASIMNLSEAQGANRGRIEDLQLLLLNLAKFIAENRGRFEDDHLLLKNLTEIIEGIKMAQGDQPPETPPPDHDPRSADPDGPTSESGRVAGSPVRTADPTNTEVGPTK